MDMLEKITHFQEQYNGPFPFNANGIVIALPNASFQEEMQTKIVFVNGSIGTTAEIFSHENMHQWWGDSVSYVEPRYRAWPATTTSMTQAGRRHQSGEHLGRCGHGQRRAADPDHLVRPGLQRSGATRRR